MNASSKIDEIAIALYLYPVISGQVSLCYCTGKAIDSVLSHQLVQEAAVQLMAVYFELDLT